MTPLLAVSDAVWLAIVGIVAMAVKEYFDQQRAKMAADAAKDVKTTLAATTSDTTQKLDSISEQVEVVHKATNSLTDRLVATTELEALARGGVEERARAEARNQSGPAAG